MQVMEWIIQTRQRLEREQTSILTFEELRKIQRWQATGWMADTYEEMADIADIQLAFAQMLLKHALAVTNHV